MDLSGAQDEPDKSAVKNSKDFEEDNHTSAAGDPKKIRLDYTRRSVKEIIFHCAATPEGRHFDVKDVILIK